MAGLVTTTVTEVVLACAAVASGVAASWARIPAASEAGADAFGFHPRRSTLMAIDRRPKSSASLQFHM